MRFVHFFLINIFLLQVITGFAQEDTLQRSKPVFKLGIFYNNYINYYGRTDSLRSGAIFPIGELWVNKNFYINAAPVIVSNNTGLSYAGTVLTAGSRFYKEKKYIANLYLVKPLYTKTTTLVQSALKFQASANYSWLNPVLNITAGADIKLSDEIDYGAVAAVDHLFKKATRSGWVLVADPTLTLNAGTQHFSQTSYKQLGVIILPGLQQEVTEQVNRFNILSIEASLPLVVAKGKWQLLAIPAYVMPRNLITVSGRPDLSEQGRNIFYVTSGIKYQF